MNNVMKRLFGLVLLLFFLVSNIEAQIDTEFWFAAPDLEAAHAEQPIWFCITSFESAATVVFEQPANPSYNPMTFYLNANDFYVYNVSDIINIVETQPYNTVLNYGFHIYSTTPVSVYYESANANSEIYSLKGSNALGMSFVVPMQYTYDNYYSSTCSRIEVIATENNTSVTFVPSKSLKGGGQPGVPINITLNRGQTYAIEASSPSGANHLRNTWITSDKPIAVNTSDDSVWFSGAWDLVGDQIVPVDLLGTDYLALWNNTSNEYLYFFPTQDDTKIYLNGSQTPIATLNLGQEYGYQLNTSAVYVHSDKPISVFQLVSDENGELGGTVLPHINCTGSRKTVYKRNGSMDVIITLVVKSNCVNDFLLNGNANYLTSSDFTVVPANSEYSYCKKDVSQYISSDGLMTIENTNEDGYFQLGVLSKGNGSGTCSYGYFSDYHEYAYAEFNMISTYCAGDNITFSYEEENVENLTLILPNGTTMTQPPFILTNVQTSQSGTYQLQGESCNGIQILDEIYINIEECITPDIPLPDNIDSANCVFFPAGTEWSIGQPIISNVGNVVIVSTPMIGDVDNDGQQEIVIPSATYSVASQLNIYNANGTLKSQFNIAGTYIWGSVGMARVKWQNNSFKTIIVVFGTNKYLYAYDANGTQLWQSNQPFSSHNGEGYLMPAISFADFNHDGWTEVFIGSEIFDAATGVLLCKANGNKGCADRTWSWSNTPYQTMAADLCGNSRLELAIGNTVYDVDIQSRTDFSANHISIARQLPSSAMTMEDGSQIPFTDGNTFLADINLDGSLDVIVMNVDGNNRNVYLYVWDVATNTIICSKKITNARKFGTPQIGDLDNNGYPEICFITGTYSDHGTGNNDKIYALKYNSSNSNGAMDVFWSIPHEDNSGSTGLTMFDFNQDGYVELVYRDCNNLRIINGSLYNHQTGQPISQPYNLAYISCSSATGVEYPVIADVDLDGEVEIIVGGETYSTDYGHLYIFKSGGIPWAPARKVWNQYMYNVTNVNIDLNIPEYLFNNATPFTDPQGMVRRPFNNFLQQATTIDQYGRPFYAVPDIATLSANITTSDSNATLNVTYTNQGDNTLNAPYYITVFANQVGGTVVQTLTINTPLPVGGTEQQSITLPMSVLCQLENVTSLVVAINCNGGGIAQNGNLQPECDITNNTEQVTINLQSDPTNITQSACDQFVWYGQTFTQSGQYETTITNTYGCDSTLVLNLIINYSDTTYLDIETCEDYLWYGTTYNQSGTYQHLLQTTAGCDSLLILNLNIGEAYHAEESMEDCDSYFWPANQQWYYQSTLDSVVVQGQQTGCDSTFVLALTLHYSDTLNLDPVTVCDGYEWHGETYTESGTYTFDTLNQYGCNRLEILNLYIIEDEIVELSPITECDEYTWHGQVYTESGTYIFDTLNQYGCTLQYILPLTINHSDTVNYNITACESYEWNGQIYSQSGNYTYNTTNEFGCNRLETLALFISDSYRQEDVVLECDGYFWPVNQQWYYISALDSIVTQGSQGACDSTFVLNLTLHYSDTLDLEPVTACDAYEWHGVTYTQSGLMTYQTTNEFGCDRLERLDLTISESETIDLPPITECDEYIWHGLAYTESGDYVFDTVNQYGCLLEYILPLTINHSDTLDWDPVTACDSYLWNGITITESGNYTINTINSEGCNRLERIQVTISYNTFDTVAPITACDNFVWHETTYTQSGVYSYETQDSWGCLHTEVLFLTVNHSSENEFSITSCEPYEWYGIVYDEPGTYTHMLTNSQGCDSLLIMHLDIGEIFMMEESAVGCDEYEWHGTVYTQSGDYQYEATNPDGCDSIFMLHLTIGPTYEGEMFAEACYSYIWVNELLTESGDYERHFSSVMGCDSLVKLHLTINEAVHHEFEQETCLTSFTWNGITYYEDGDYEQTLTANNSCDSIVTMHLKFHEQFNTDITVNICENSYVWNGIEYSETGVYQQSFLSSAGCDSIVNLHLNIADVFTINIDTISCGTFYWDGEPLEAGSYQYQYLTSLGCDSIVNLHLDIVDSYEVNIDTTSCGAYKWGEEWLTESGNYQSLFTTSNGCDSLVNLRLTVGITPVCSIQGLSLIYPATDLIIGVYPYYLVDSMSVNPDHVRWSIDRDDWLLIPHGASCDLVCLSAGQGILRVWTEGELCDIDTTMLLNASFFDVGENEASLKLYPNPTKGKITVEWDEIREINVYDLLGQKLMACEYGKEQTCVLDLSRFQHSVYVLEIVSSTGRVIRPVILTQ